MKPVFWKAAASARCTGHARHVARKPQAKSGRASTCCRASTGALVDAAFSTAFPWAASQTASRTGVVLACGPGHGVHPLLGALTAVLKEDVHAHGPAPQDACMLR